MAELEPITPSAPPAPASSGPRSKDDVALELMKFIAVTTGYGKPTYSGTGFSGKPAVASADEHATALLELFQKCRQAVNQEG